MTQTPVETPQGLLLPSGRLVRPRVVESDEGFERVAGFMNRREWRQYQAMLRARYFIFHNDGGQYGERGVCKARTPDGTWRGCGRKHMYITSYCVEMPFRGGEGLEEGLWLSFRATTDDARKSSILQAISKLPDIAQGHPFMAHDLRPKESGEDWFGILISLPEAITREQAVRFAAKINDSRPPQPYCLVDKCANFLTPNTQCGRGIHHFGLPDE